jgi:hypothetical protein
VESEKQDDETNKNRQNELPAYDGNTGLTPVGGVGGDADFGDGDE